MTDVETEAGVVVSDPEIMGGAPVFVGTRLPVRALFDYLEHGHSIDVFLEHFQSADRDQVISVLRHAKRLVMQHAYPVR